MRRAVPMLLLAAVLAGCHSAAAPPAPAPAAPVIDAAATLATLRKVDDHPLWTMRVHGDYDPLVVPDALRVRPTTNCSLFTAHGDPADPLFGRNFDFPHQPALLLFTAPAGRHASVSMVDTSYLGLTSDADFTTEKGRQALLGAHLLPFDGMNAKGLTVGMATAPDARATVRPERRTVGSVRIMRMVLDEASTVDEAIAVFERFNVDFSDGTGLHYLFADAHGGAAVLEFVDGRLVVERQRGPWQVLTNIQLAGSDEATRLADPRYATASGALRAANGKLDQPQAMDLLARVHQPHTQWSIVYGQKSGKVRIATGRRFDVVHDFSLTMA
ncbi:carcinine hydrolase/isopenicillin-N N-acyltransferase family protein [Amycolatopsis suaedae]|uniref:Linear amide C-N hydrolase n=1 Tax=Amycolatopsis suaedae TaxID=2510978 RepID=A0A4V2EL26_9PSEU|nr:carcinine hydrolase/isopenicillin-N N-acyltransferase family protein [Amycolatopsis suaedae]RZQ60095.1 linear amide C-N hydrolase [Amycolatopsis suaedae]